MSKTWFVTGATRGIGAAIAKAALAAGHNVVATGRKPEGVVEALGTDERLLVAELDVTDAGKVDLAARAAIDRFGKVDVLVNNAGYGQLGSFEGTTLDEFRAQFDTNFFGLIAVTQALLPGMRERRSGRVFNISSIGGLRGMAGGSPYCSSKFAIEGLSQALDDELRSFGIRVTSVSPGFFRTDFLDATSIRYAESTIQDYAETMSQSRAFFEGHNHQQAGDPAKLASALLQLAEVDNPPVSFVVGPDAVGLAEASLKRTQGDIDIWRTLSCSTDGDW